MRRIAVVVVALAVLAACSSGSKPETMAHWAPAGARANLALGDLSKPVIAAATANGAGGAAVACKAALPKIDGYETVLRRAPDKALRSLEVGAAEAIRKSFTECVGGNLDKATFDLERANELFGEANKRVTKLKAS